jgi:anti-sigma factor RsiW
MDCLEVRDNLVAAIDGELEPAITQEVEEHLAGCPHCRAERDALQRTMQMAAAWMPHVLDIVPDIRAALDRDLLMSLVEQVAALTSEVKSLRAEIAELRRAPSTAPMPRVAVGVAEADILPLLKETQRTSIRAMQTRKLVEDPWNLAIS